MAIDFTDTILVSGVYYFVMLGHQFILQICKHLMLTRTSPEFYSIDQAAKCSFHPFSLCAAVSLSTCCSNESQNY